MILEKEAREIREILREVRERNSLSFIEETHTYLINDGSKIITPPSVSSVLKCFYDPFDSNNTYKFKSCNGDLIKEAELLYSWNKKGDISSSKGSRTHYLLEDYLLSMYGSYKDLRIPIFDCDEETTIQSDSMIEAGKKFIELMHKRGATLLDTEVVLGSIDLGYVGQPDKAWIIRGKSGELGLIITDWKSNEKKNFEVHSYTNKMLAPFDMLWNNALGHYNLQLPLYAKLIIDMLKGTKFEDIKYLGSIIVLLQEDTDFLEYRVPRTVSDAVMNLNVKEYLIERKELLDHHKFLIKRDSEIRDRLK